MDGKCNRYQPLYDGSRFQCPWTNERRASTWNILLHHLFKCGTSNPSQEEMKAALSYSRTNRNERSVQLCVTWVAHACLLVQMDNLNILTDPVFSDTLVNRFLSPTRYFPNALTLEELPPIDVVLISHNHYDHLDYPSVIFLYKKFPSIKFLVPLNLLATFTESFAIPETNVEEFRWWAETKLSPSVTAAFVPAQHWTRRGFFDENKTLWGGWCLLGEESVGSFYFAGDTGYCKEVFRQIGDEYGPFDVAAIPIGAYEPRKLLKFVHLNPSDALEVHRDVRSKHSIGIHWGTFSLGCEGTLEPRRFLEEMKSTFEFGEDTTFDALRMGQTMDRHGRII